MKILYTTIVYLLICSALFGQSERFIRITDNPKGIYGPKRLWNPEYFQGYNKKQNYFEGWYFKMVSQDGIHRYAFIPGISLGEDSHAFVQFIDGQTGKTKYHRYDLDDFYYSSSRFAVWVGPNFFSADSFYVELGVDSEQILGKGIIHSRVEHPTNFLSPGIMGWYRFVPFMECFHGVVSINHDITGDFLINNKVISFNNGKGYIEKDWGKSMPTAWIWTQSNTFNDGSNTSFMLSVASIPWIGNSFTGFLGFLWVNDKLYSFATYTGARISELERDDDRIKVLINDKDFTIEFIGLKGMRGELLAPVAGDMSRTIHESIDAEIQVTLWDKNGNLLYQGKAQNAGLELVGKIGELNP
ncbi:MAG: tocopherol cyclase family protein [Bacteroidales bacterium]